MEENAFPKILCVFEDGRYPNFFPLTLNRPVFDLFIGTQTLKERIMAELNPEKLVLLCRPYLAPVLAEAEGADSKESTVKVNESDEGEILFINSRLLVYETDVTKLLEELDENCVIKKNGNAVAARLTDGKASSFIDHLLEPLSDKRVDKIIQEIKRASADPKQEGKAPNETEGNEASPLIQWAEQNEVALKDTGIGLLSYYWQLIGENGACILDDFQKNPLRGTAPESELFKGVDLINEEDIVIGSEVEVRSGTVLDASEGPIIIADKVLIEPTAIIKGPCYIGEGSIIRGGAKIGHATSIGKQCRVGGEVEETIIAPYSNKQHEGFLGHSYVGSWVNIGAGACNSDLKNNYSQVRSWCAGIMKETGRRFLGVVIGDHSKIAILTRINTGTVVGFNANVISGGFPPKLVPSFTWLLEPEFVEHDLKKSVETAKVMMARRNVSFTDAMGDLFKVIYRFSRQSGQTV